MKKILCLLVMTALLAGAAQADLIAYWDFEEGSGTTITSTVNGVTVTGTYGETTTSPQWVQGVLGGAVRLIGGGDNRRFNVDMTPLNPGSTTPIKSLTMACWVLPENQPSGGYTGLFTTRAAVGKDLNGTLQTACQVGMNIVDGDQKLDYRITNDGGYSPNGSYAENRWQHLVMVFDPNNLEKRYYVDGELISSRTDSRFANQEIHEFNVMQLGMETGGTGRNFRGSIDELAVWDNALTDAEVKALYDNSVTGTGTSVDGTAYVSGYPVGGLPTGDLGRGLINYWKFDETTGTTAADEISGENWSVYGTNYTWIGGLVNNAFEITSVSSTTVLNNRKLNGLNGAEQFAWAVWIKPDRATTQTWAGLLSISTGVGFLTGIDTNTAAPAGYLDWDFRICGRSMNSHSAANDIKLNDEVWNLVVVNFDYTKGNVPGALEIWINGKNAADYNTSPNTYYSFEKPGDWNYRYGDDRASTSRRYCGLSDDMMIWNRTLSAKEIATIFNNRWANPLAYPASDLLVSEAVDESIGGVPQKVYVPVKISQLDPDVPVTFPLTMYAVPTDAGALSDLVVTPAVFNAIDDDPNIVFTTIDNSDRQFNRVWTFYQSTDPNTADYAPSEIIITVQDEDAPQFVLTDEDSVVVAENVAVASVTDTFTIGLDSSLVSGETIQLVLASDPNFILLSDNDETDLASITIDYVFGADSPVEVTVKAVDNTDIDNGTVPYSSYPELISIAMTQSVTGTLAPADVNVTVLEDDCGAMGYEFYDLSGPSDAPDCRVDLYDLQVWLQKWLDCYYPNMAPGVCP